MTRLELAARIAAGLAAHINFKIAEIPEQSLSIADELIRLEAETRPKPEPEPEQELPFVMVVGGVYENRRGRHEEIFKYNEGLRYPFLGKSGESYTENGVFNTRFKSDLDLIKRIR